MGGRTDYGHYTPPVDISIAPQLFTGGWVTVGSKHDVRSYSRMTLWLNFLKRDSVGMKWRFQFYKLETGLPFTPPIFDPSTGLKVTMSPELFQLKTDADINIIHSVILDGIGWMEIQIMADTPGVNPGELTESSYTLTYNG